NTSTGTDTHTVLPAGTTTTVTSDPDPTAFGQPVTFTAQVTPTGAGTGMPTGTVTFVISDGGGTTTVPVDVDGTAQLTLNSLPVGSHSVTATYNGDTAFTGSSGADTHTVGRATTSTTVASTPDPTVFGQPVVLTAVVTPLAPGAGTSTGTVAFSVSGGPSLTAALAGGVASVSTDKLPAGDYTVTADYFGDANFAPSTGTDTHSVDRAATTTAVVSAPDPSVFGQAVTFTAAVTPVAPGVGTPTGTVTFTESSGGTVTVPLDANGIATVTADTLPARTYSGTATYNGDGNFAPSTGTHTHIVQPAATTTTVTSSPDPSVFGEAVTFTAAVAPVAPGAGTPTGTVT
ncbi:Ig-like domain-containing protein, partial [Streptomyces sp. NPDC051776]|uniref:Ig-like domain-containing protein n=1 Tax=Streptomyces sp. NPDC051776 TaxID=3155414 RepID=UPI0034333568